MFSNTDNLLTDTGKQGVDNDVWWSASKDGDCCLASWTVGTFLYGIADITIPLNIYSSINRLVNDCYYFSKMYFIFQQLKVFLYKRGEIIHPASPYQTQSRSTSPKLAKAHVILPISTSPRQPLIPSQCS